MTMEVFKAHSHMLTVVPFLAETNTDLFAISLKCAPRLRPCMPSFSPERIFMAEF